MFPSVLLASFTLFPGFYRPIPCSKKPFAAHHDFTECTQYAPVNLDDNMIHPDILPFVGFLFTKKIEYPITETLFSVRLSVRPYVTPVYLISGNIGR